MLRASWKTSGRFRYGFRRRHRPTLVYGFRRFCFMFSVVAGNVLLLFPSLVCLWFPSWQETFLSWFPSLDFDGFCRRRRIQHFRMYWVIPRCLSFQDWFPSLVSFYGFRRAEETFFMVSVVGFLLMVFRRSRTHFLMVSVFGFSVMVSGCYRTAAVSPMETVKIKHQDVSKAN